MAGLLLHFSGRIQVRSPDKEFSYFMEYSLQAVFSSTSNHARISEPGQYSARHDQFGITVHSTRTVLSGGASKD